MPFRTVSRHRPGQNRAASAAALLLFTAGLAAQTAPAPKPVPASTAGAVVDETILLSPFTVVEDDRGYQAFNTLAGTRLNSKLEDLGSSITVVTMQQMQDTAVLDINDLFRYEASTEGTDDFTQFTPNRTVGVNPDGSYYAYRIIDPRRFILSTSFDL